MLATQIRARVDKSVDWVWKPSPAGCCEISPCNSRFDEATTEARRHLIEMVAMKSKQHSLRSNHFNEVTPEVLQVRCIDKV